MARLFFLDLVSCWICSYRYEGENFVLDQQAVRAALKAFRTVFGPDGNSKPSSSITQNLPPSSNYLRLLASSSSEPPILKESSWNDPETLILLLEWRAALLVHELAQTSQDPDATIYQRVSKGTTEAFVARRVGDMIDGLKSNPLLNTNDVGVLSRLYLLVRSLLYFLPRILLIMVTYSISKQVSNRL